MRYLCHLTEILLRVVNGPFVLCDGLAKSLYAGDHWLKVGCSRYGGEVGCLDQQRVSLGGRVFDVSDLEAG